MIARYQKRHLAAAKIQTASLATTLRIAPTSAVSLIVTVHSAPIIIPAVTMEPVHSPTLSQLAPSILATLLQIVQELKIRIVVA